MVNLILILRNCRQPLPSWQGLLRPTSLPRPPWYEGAWPILGEAPLAQEPQQLQSAGATTIHPSICHPFTHPHINLAIHIFSTTHPSIHSSSLCCPYIYMSICHFFQQKKSQEEEERLYNNASHPRVAMLKNTNIESELLARRREYGGSGSAGRRVHYSDRWNFPSLCSAFLRERKHKLYLIIQFKTCPKTPIKKKSHHHHPHPPTLLIVFSWSCLL